MATSEQRVGDRAEQKRRWDRENRHMCIDCGAKTGCHTAPSHAEKRCWDCEQIRRRQGRVEIARLYNEGLSIRVIAERVGTTVNSVGTNLTRARKDGLIGYRYSVEGGRRVAGR